MILSESVKIKIFSNNLLNVATLGLVNMQFAAHVTSKSFISFESNAHPSSLSGGGAPEGL